jgi:predicted nucleic acid-binding Zn ribbon protein
MQKFSDQPLTRCPECSKKSLRKVYTPVGIVFKGSGFYATDHRSPSGQNRSAEKSDPVEKSNETSAVEKKAEAVSSAPSAPAAESTPAVSKA